MYAQRVDQFMLQKGKFFPPEKTMYIKERFMAQDDSKSYLLDSVPLMNPSTFLVVGLILPGVEKMMMGDNAMGLLKICTCGGAGIWWFIDLFTISKKVKDLNFSKFMTMI